MIEKYLREKKGEIYTYLTAYIQSYFPLQDKNIPWLEDSLQRILLFTQNGKCIRGSLFLLTCEMYGEKVQDSHYKIACGLELFHSALLIHDDIIDNDFIRRGDKTIFSQYMDIGENEKIKNTREFGNSMGICVGDMSLFLSFSLFGSVDFPTNVHNTLVNNFVHEAYAVGCGQMQDIYLSRKDTNPLREKIYSVYLYKTARYTFSLPMVLGAIVTKQDDETKNKLIRLGECIGLIFQIRDDALRYFALQEQIGKDVGSDIRENTKTIFRYLLYDRSSDEEKERLNEIFGNANANMKDFVYVEECMYKKGIVEDIENEIESYKRESHQIIESLNIKTTYKNIFFELIEFVYNRKK